MRANINQRYLIILNDEIYHNAITHIDRDLCIIQV